jgi:hypothetical protein
MSVEEVEIRILPPKGCLFLNRKGSYVLDILYMTHCNPILSDIIYGSCGAYVLPNLGRVRDSLKSNEKEKRGCRNSAASF